MPKGSSSGSNKNCIIIRGAREHNLKNIDLEIPRDRLIVITGLSGSGKSTLAFDTIYAEGQRRYVESLSAYARQFLEQMQKPNVDFIEGLSPAISIEQKMASRNPRSTVGTITEIYDYLRVLFARIGQPHCHLCGREISSQTPQEITDRVLSLSPGSRIQLMSPIVRGRKGEYREVFENIRRQGYVRARVDGEVRDLSDEISLDRYKIHDIDVVIDRLMVKPDIQSRLTDSVETALKLGKGIIRVHVAPPADSLDGKTFETLYSEHYACADCGVSFEELAPRMFSFNSPHGACRTCTGLGTTMVLDPDLIIPDPSLSINEDAIKPWRVRHREITRYKQMVTHLAKHHGFDLDTPFEKLEPRCQQLLLYGSDSDNVTFTQTRRGRRRRVTGPFEGIIPIMERWYRETNSRMIEEYVGRYMGDVSCPDCKGARLRPESLAVTIADKSIVDLTGMSIKKAKEYFENLQLNPTQRKIGQRVVKEIRERLNFMVNVGLDYLTLDRSAATLAGGESQRIRLATQIGSGLVGVLYILDEPSIGLHQRDNRRLLGTLKRLKDLGNTVIIVEHDEITIRSADFVIDLGPGAGVHGGEVVALGTPKNIMSASNSITGKYLKGKMKIDVPAERRTVGDKFLTLQGASEHNLKSIDVSFPLGTFICVTGVSGSGKSTLVDETLYPALAQKFYRSKMKPGAFKGIEGAEHLDKVIDIDQSPIGRTPRSNPATYIGLFTHIRGLYARLPESKVRGYRPGRFSFNVKGGRCEACMGDGVKKIEMHFLPDVYVTCEICKGKRYNRETLDVRYKGRNIADVLDMTVEEALEFFVNVPSAKRKLQTLFDVGLGYIKLGQSSTTLSGGEAQRVKLAAELSKKSTGKTLYILDEPTTGLHFDDIKRLLGILQQLTSAGNTVIVIEHNLDVVKTADYIIDLGPEGGDDGGQVVAVGTPEEIVGNGKSYTGKYLRQILAGR